MSYKSNHVLGAFYPFKEKWHYEEEKRRKNALPPQRQSKINEFTVKNHPISPDGYAPHPHADFANNSTPALPTRCAPPKRRGTKRGKDTKESGQTTLDSFVQACNNNTATSSDKETVNNIDRPPLQYVEHATVDYRSTITLEWGPGSDPDKRRRYNTLRDRLFNVSEEEAWMEFMQSTADGLRSEHPDIPLDMKSAFSGSVYDFLNVSPGELSRLDLTTSKP